MSDAQWKAARPTLLPECERAVEAWHFCAGWAPERVPYAAAVLEIDDVALLVDLLAAIRDTIDRHHEAQRKAADAAKRTAR